MFVLSMIDHKLVEIKSMCLFTCINYDSDYVVSQVKLVNVRSHIGWGGERSIPYKGVETSP